ncbi:hypothetical protein GL263_24400 [Streptomyces durbertensis]|uniref:Uncharacterized protein n=1 Tax=Streptomyces durbertensis TaxID=2448886 RepID=A0ABR6EMU9_9ACTN|nr:hypothetical protein [Streptomyces durbertensis]MBB1246667.1 hypothetical protein [Streptomyces durbertensis]
MRRTVDLDEAAAEVAARRPGWRAAGLLVAEPTWRDEAAPWPQTLETDRARVSHPDSLGLLVSGPAGTLLSVVLFRGGWADVDYFAGGDDAGVLPASGIRSAAEFGVRLDAWVGRVFGERGG